MCPVLYTMKTIQLITIIALMFFTLFLTSQAYAPCISGPGNNCNNYPPQTLAQINSDKLSYEILSKPVITIVGVPSTVAHLEIDDFSSNIMLEHDVKLSSNGTARDIIDTSSYKPGIYSAIATSPVSRLTTSFAVGLRFSEEMIVVQADKNSYNQGDNVTIIGWYQPNTWVQLSLINPVGISVKSDQTFSDKTGHFSSHNIVVPTNAVSGVWQIDADIGVAHTRVQIKVNSTVNNHYGINDKAFTSSPLKQLKAGTRADQVKCNQGFQLVFKAETGSPACVKPDTATRLIERGWASIENAKDLVILTEGQREGPLLVQKIFSDSIEGLDFREYPLATNVGNKITMHIGDTASNGCTIDLTLVKISNGNATFLKKENFTKVCPICLSENTVIDTPTGSISIKDLKTGMQVLTQDVSGHKQIGTILQTGRTMVPPDHKMIHTILDDKREVYASPNHPTADGRFFGELLAGDDLDGSKIKSVEQVSYNGTYTYDILPSGQTGFYWANGILVASTLK